MRSTRLVALVVLAVLAGLVVPAARPPGVSAQPADTVGIVKDGEAPSNAEIAVRLSETTPLPDVDVVLIGRDDEFADSLASGVLQSASPLLLVPSDGPLPDRVRDELSRLGPTRAILLGGELALTPRVAQELADLGYAVERRQGESRFETAVAIARSDAPAADTAILARAFASEGATDPTQAFADALAAGGMAAANGWPVLLTQTDVLTGSTRRYLEQAGIRRIEIMGGTAAISASVEAELTAMGLVTERIAGDSRAGTAIAVAEKLGAADAADAAHVVLVQGQTADAWAGGFAAAARAALLGAPIVLAAEDRLPPETRDWLEGGFARAGTRPAFGQAGGGPVLTCVVVPSLCEEARVVLGLPPAGVTQPDLVSLGVDGQHAGGRDPSVDAAGEVVAFVSDGVVVEGVDDGLAHVYVRRPGPDGPVVELVDVRPDGTPATRGVSFSVGPTDVSGDGRAVAFTSDDPGLDSAGAGGGNLRGSYVRYLDEGRTQLVSLGPDGEPITAFHLVLDDDATTAAYRGQIRSAGFAILVHDLVTGEVEPIRTADGEIVVDGSGVGTPAISGDGGTVAFYTDLPLVPEDTNEATDTYVYDVAEGTLERVSVTSDGAQAETTDFNDDGRLGLSRDGRLVVFASGAANLDEGDDPSFEGRDVFLHDRSTGTTTMLSRGVDGLAANTAAAPSISRDGRWAAFASGDLVGSGQPGCGIHRVDLATSTVVRLDLDPLRRVNNCPSRIRVADGGAVVADPFSAFTEVDTDSQPDVYLWPAP